MSESEASARPAPELAVPSSTTLAGPLKRRDVLELPRAAIGIVLRLLMAFFIAGLLLDVIMQSTLALGVLPVAQHDLAGFSHYSQWTVVLVSTATLSFFTLAYVAPLGKANWRTAGLVQGFILALFTEMYGFPLTVYFLASFLGVPFVGGDPGHLDGHLLAQAMGSVTGLEVTRAAAFTMAVSSGLMAVAFMVIGIGWGQIYRARGTLVVSGLYRHVRHPQYTGILLVTVALLIHWPTIVTVPMWPVLAVMYYRLARREERQAEASFGDAYRTYRLRTKMFMPGLL